MYNERKLQALDAEKDKLDEFVKRVSPARLRYGGHRCRACDSEDAWFVRGSHRDGDPEWQQFSPPYTIVGWCKCPEGLKADVLAAYERLAQIRDESIHISHVIHTEKKAAAEAVNAATRLPMSECIRRGAYYHNDGRPITQNEYARAWGYDGHHHMLSEIERRATAEWKRRCWETNDRNPHRITYAYPVSPQKGLTPRPGGRRAARQTGVADVHPSRRSIIGVQGSAGGGQGRG